MKKRLLPLLLSTALILPLLCPAAAAEETATRRDLADALYALANRPSVSQTQLYSDLTEADDALHWISSEGYMVGYGSHTMAPDQAITRNQLATVLYEYAKEHNLALTKRAPIEAGTPKWADDAISWATANGVLDGIDRDQAITASELDRALSNLSKVAEDPAAKDLNAIMDSPGVSGYAVMAYRDGELIYQRTGGDRYIDAADPANNLPLELDSRYRTASISKTFAAVGAMRLWNRESWIWIVMSATIWDLPSAILTTQTRPLPPGCSSRTPPRFRTAVYIPLRLSIPSRNFSPQKGNIGWMENILKTPLTVWTEAPETGSTTAI